MLPALVLQLNKMLQWAEAWSSQVKKSFLKDWEAHTAMKVTIMKKLEYPLLAATLTEPECKKVMAKLLQQALQKAGFNRHFPRAAFYGPGRLMGGEISPLYYTMIGKHISEISGEAPFGTPIGHLIRTRIESCKLELSRQGDLFHKIM